MTALTNRKQQRQLNPRSDPMSPWWHVDPFPLMAAIALSLAGCVVIYSATRGRDPDAYNSFFLQRQALFVGIGALLTAASTLVDYRVLARFAWVFYAGGVALLAAVLQIGVIRNGAQSWFEFGSIQLQPSEFAKLALIVALAAYISRCGDELSLRELGIALVIALVPLGLVLRQPDVGTGMVMMFIVAAILLVGGANASHLTMLVGGAIAAFAGILNSPLLQDYQRNRLRSFLDPDSVTVDSYNQTQAQIAIGNGGLTGTGFGEGTQTNSGLVPEQQTDFIFTVVGEEFGFVGGVTILALFALLIWRTYRIARLAGDRFGALVAVGILAMFVFQLFQSVGMTMGIMPITGIPLPFVSYGGSSALTSYIAVGLLLNVHMRRFQADIDRQRGG